jgi:hypothetical protein
VSSGRNSEVNDRWHPIFSSNIFQFLQRAKGRGRLRASSDFLVTVRTADFVHSRATVKGGGNLAKKGMGVELIQETADGHLYGWQGNDIVLDFS